MRRAGIDVVGDIPWGTHFCLFYDTKADLLETLVSYCKAGLQSQEFCLWVVAPPSREKTPSKPCDKLFLVLIATCLTVASRWLPLGLHLQDGAFDLNRVIAR